ncbi:MAG: hypothetical protein WC465_00115 [Patescibacteria group bacterium]
MGNPFLVQACLRLDDAQIPKPLEFSEEYHFKKIGHRLYQINVPMDLRTRDWKFLARIVITEYTIGKNRTEGTFILVKDFSEAEKEIISKTFVDDKEVENIVANLEKNK